MKRFHVHLHVDDLAQSIGFYSQLFAAPPSRVETDYAKWMLDDPRLNFAISTRGSRPGIDHLGFQVDDADDLAELKARASAADLALIDEGATTCCYARSEKHWVTDPQGIAWEHFHTLGNIPVFNEQPAATESNSVNASAGACCAPATPATSTAPRAAASSACCAPAPAQAPAAASTSTCCAPQAPGAAAVATPTAATVAGCGPAAGRTSSCC